MNQPDSLIQRVTPNVRLALLTAVLLIGAALRLVGLDKVTPPGLEHDEVAHWLINQDILAGNHAIYFTEAYGHEALYHYFQTGIGILVGDHALGLRLPSAYLGIILIAISYALGRRLFGWPVALAAAAFLAVLFWPVFYSRLALRASTLPVLSGLAAYFWWRGWSPAYERVEPVKTDRIKPLRNLVWFGLAGVLAGLSIHTYMAGRAVPVFFVAFALYLAIFHRQEFWSRRRGIAIFFLSFVAIALPLVLYLSSNPGAESRISEVDAPLRALMSGDLRPVLENAGRIALMFGIKGDPLWRQGIAGRPVFGPLLALLFYLSLPLVLWRLRDERYAFLLLWLATAVIPSLVTVDAPSSIRIVNLLPVLMLFPMLVIHKSGQLSTAQRWLSTGQWITGAGLVIALMWGFQLWRTVDGLWREWPANDEVRFVWQEGLTDAARYLDASDESGPVAVGGWTPDTMDPPTMALSLRRDDLSLRFYDPLQSLVLPRAAPEEDVRLIRPSILPLAPALEALVQGWSLPVEGDFALYQAIAPVSITPSIAQDVVFGDEIRLLGYDLVEPCMIGQTACTVLTYWQVEAVPDGDRRMFLHVSDDAGNVIAQDDRLGVPATFWQAGDIIVQQFTLPSTAGELQLGVYDPTTEQRLPTVDGTDSTNLSSGLP